MREIEVISVSQSVGIIELFLMDKDKTFHLTTLDYLLLGQVAEKLESLGLHLNRTQSGIFALKQPFIARY